MEVLMENRPFSEFRNQGLLWLINTTVFHPRGYAIGFDIDDEGNVTGWSLIGDGSEPWQYSCDDEIQEALDGAFKKTKALMP